MRVCGGWVGMWRAYFVYPFYKHLLTSLLLLLFYCIVFYAIVLYHSMSQLSYATIQCNIVNNI